MTYRGHVKNGVIVLDEPGALPDGMRVDVAPVEDTEHAADERLPTWAEVFDGIAGKARGLPSDLARNHGHYLHGTPKR
jgi:hypothetical protein